MRIYIAIDVQFILQLNQNAQTPERYYRSVHTVPFPDLALCSAWLAGLGLELALGELEVIKYEFQWHSKGLLDSLLALYPIVPCAHCNLHWTTVRGRPVRWEFGIGTSYRQSPLHTMFRRRILVLELRQHKLKRKATTPLDEILPHRLVPRL